jgi:hypothetical protein
MMAGGVRGRKVRVQVRSTIARFAWRYSLRFTRDFLAVVNLLVLERLRDRLALRVREDQLDLLLDFLQPLMAEARERMPSSKSCSDSSSGSSCPSRCTIFSSCWKAFRIWLRARRHWGAYSRTSDE